MRRLLLAFLILCLAVNAQAGINFQQTDTAVTNGAAQYCSGLAAATTQGTLQASNGGTPGTNITQGAILGANSAVLRMIFIEIPVAGGVSWNAGTWTVSFHVISASSSPMTWEEAWICQITSGGTNVATIGSATALGISLQTTGVKSTTVSGSAITPSAGDEVMIVIGAKSGTGGPVFGVTLQNTELVDSPFTAASACPRTLTLLGVGC